MPFTKLLFRPGINRETTEYSNEGGWRDCDKIRFRAGAPETIGGWEKVGVTPLQGTPRSLFPWAALDGTTYVASGTNLKYYVGYGGLGNDITPIRATTAAGDATFAATNGSTTITVTDTAHGASINDFVTFSAAVSLGGTITAGVLNAEYQITRVVSANVYEITASVAANASDTGNGGAATVAEYQLTTGLAASVGGTGWGAGHWGRGTWSSPANIVLLGSQLRIWSQDNFGEDLLLCPRGGGIYYWDTSAGVSTRAVNITSLPGSLNAPTIASQVLVSERERYVLVFGCDSQYNIGVADPLLVRFSSQESLIDWNVADATNTAGEIRLGSGSKFVAAVQTKQQVIIFTDMSMHAMQYLGPPYVFGVQEISTNVTLAGPNAVVALGDTLFWMGFGDFYRYDGAVAAVPCGVKEFVFSDINLGQLEMVCAGHNGSFSEVWWFYPSDGNLDNDRYVVYNYAQNVWYYGALGRTAWVDRGLLTHPLAASSDGYVYYQEAGFDDGSENPPVPLEPYIESSVFDIGDGDQFMFATRVAPDITFRNSTANLAAATMTISARNFPGDAFAGTAANAVTKSATLPVEQFTDQLFIRLRGRSMSLRVESSQLGVGWRLGSPRLELRTDGKR